MTDAQEENCERPPASSGLADRQLVEHCNQICAEELHEGPVRRQSHDGLLLRAPEVPEPLLRDLEVRDVVPHGAPGLHPRDAHRDVDAAVHEDEGDLYAAPRPLHALELLVDLLDDVLPPELLQRLRDHRRVGAVQQAFAAEVRNALQLLRQLVEHQALTSLIPMLFERLWQPHIPAHIQGLLQLFLCLDHLSCMPFCCPTDGRYLTLHLLQVPSATVPFVDRVGYPLEQVPLCRPHVLQSFHCLDALTEPLGEAEVGLALVVLLLLM
mmetsp:Transcript_110866/g.308793  ORF Transcript_110866/g.308793 Transcript_110866/m.308793 type:complete len:268 (-) Transcript_110866:2410-3213(-)